MREKEFLTLVKKNQVVRTNPDDEIQICQDYRVIDCFLYAIIDKSIDLQEFLKSTQAKKLSFNHDEKIYHQNSITSKANRSRPSTGQSTPKPGGNSTSSSTPKEPPKKAPPTKPI